MEEKAHVTPADVQRRHDRVKDFRAAIYGGTGFTIEDDGLELNGKRFQEALDNGSFRLSGLEDVAKAFHQNQERLWEYARTPQSIFDFGRLYQQAYALICAPLNRNPNTSTGEFVGEVTEETLETARVVGDSLQRWALGIEDMPVSVGLIETGEVAAYAGREYPRRQRQLDGYFSSLVIHGWIVFETLSEDLWESALNAHPTTLAALGGKTTISFDDLLKNGFDVGKKMGTILKDKKKDVSFRALADIQDAYSVAFSKQGSAIVDILKRPRLRCAAAVRNLLVHKRGIVDQEFLKQTAGIPDLPAVTIGDNFPLSGKISAQLVDSCRHSAIALVLAVHAWIVGHPEKRP